MTWDDKICRSFSPFRRLFQSRRLSALAASAIKKDLEGFRQVVLARRMAGGTWWDMVGHGGTWWDMVGHGGTWWDRVGHGGTGVQWQVWQSESKISTEDDSRWIIIIDMDSFYL